MLNLGSGFQDQIHPDIGILQLAVRKVHVDKVHAGRKESEVCKCQKVHGVKVHGASKES